MRFALLGGGTIARLFLEHIRRGDLGRIDVTAVCGRSAESAGASLAKEYGVAFVVGVEALIASKPDVVVEAASHDAVREHLVRLLSARIAVIVLSGGALADDALRTAAETAAQDNDALLYVPSGGIGALDALKAACIAGVDEASIEVAKPPAAWKKIAFVEALGVNLDALREARVLFDGTAREGVPHFPQNVNIAAVLSMAGIGFDRTQLRVVADPALTHNTHTIRICGASGAITIVLENVPAPENPKTAWLACYSALAALKQMNSKVRYGT
ncbi:MAG: aspartate dehydrogenase [Betaproteobacteria bacterium]|nr:aspartate dehydrogenase [Betaproteobacteria bacterium]